MSDEVIVLSRTQVINVEPASGRVSVTNAGPPGPAGPAGIIGDSLWSIISTVLKIDPDLLPIPTIEIAPGVSGDTYIRISEESSFRTIGISANDLINIGTNGDLNLSSGKDITISAAELTRIVHVIGGNSVYIDANTNDIQLNAGGEIDLLAVLDVNLTPGQDFNVEAGRDILLTADHDLSLNSGGSYGIFLQAGTGMKLDAGLDALELDTSDGNDIKIGETVRGGDILVGYGGGGSTKLKRDGGDIELQVNGGHINLITGSDGGTVRISGGLASSIETFLNDDHAAELVFVGNDADDVSRTGFVSISYGVMSMQGLEGVSIYTNTGPTHGIYLGIGGDEYAHYTSPVIFDVVPAAPSDAMINVGQAVFWRSGDSIRLKAKDSAGVVKSLTIGTLT